ncbi:MAG: hypothetical protein AB7K71_07170 [Polyangiaceae bacterium]
MLAAHCPQCGAASPVCVAQPELLDCAYCPYVGRPDDRVVAELHAARAALFHIHATRRQFSVGQRRAIERGKTQRLRVFVLLAFLVAPLFLCGGGCGALLVFGKGGAAVSDLPIFIALLAPSALVLAVGWLLMRWHKRGLERLMASCAAIPPAAQGRPAMCHVCGAPLHEADKNVVVRCTYCHADNVTSSDVVRSVAQNQAVIVNAMAGSVENAAVQVARNTSTALTLSFVFALLSPVLAILLACGVVMVMLSIDVTPDPNERYAYVDVAGTRCYGSFHKTDKGYSLSFGKAFPELVDALEVGPNDVHTVPASELVGKEMLGADNKPRRVRKLTRTLADATNQLDDGFTSTGLSPIGACEKPPNMSELAEDSKLTGCAGIYAVQGTPYVVTGDDKVFRVDLATRQLAQVSSFPDKGPLFFDGKQIMRHVPAGSVWAVTLSGSPVRGKELLTGVDLFALSGTHYVLVSGVELKLQDDTSELKTLYTFKTKPQALAASASRIFWSGEEGVMSLPVAGGEPTKLFERQYNAPALTALGDYLMVRGSSCYWLHGKSGERSECPYTGPLFSEYPNAPLADADHGYLIPNASSRREGIHGFSIGDVPRFDRHYGPQSPKPSCMGIDDQYVYWVEGSRLMRDLKAQK